MSDEPIDEQWSPQARERLVETADRLADAVRTHARALTELAGSSETDEQAAIAANEVLVDATLAFEDAQYALTGTLPYGLDEEPDDDVDGWDEVPAAGPAGQPPLGEDVEEIEVDAALSIVSRHDYVILDAREVVSAAQAAAGLPDGDPRVADLGVALAEVAKAAGTWDRLERHPGIRATGGVTTVIAHEDLLIGDPEQWPDDISVDGDLLYTQIDAY